MAHRNKKRRNAPSYPELPGLFRTSSDENQVLLPHPAPLNPDTPRLKLPIDSLDEGSCLAPEAAQNMYAAARVSLGAHYDVSPQRFRIEEPTQGKLHAGEVAWEPADDRMIASYAYGPKRIEEAAECIALAALRARDNLRVRQSCEALTGADWIVSGPSLGLEDARRVEISGIDVALSDSQIDYRLAAKLGQIQRGKRRSGDDLPGMAVVVALSPGWVLMHALANQARPVAQGVVHDSAAH
jgi:hypothetical protein